KETWLQISDLFYKKTNFPNCLGAIDGKHIRCKNPNHAGSLYFNYKKYFSIVLMAVVDANLNFISIDVGAYGREADPTVFRESVFGKKLYSNLLEIPEPRALPSSENNIQPFVFVADEAFGLHTNVMRPFPGRGLNETRRVFNYRLSRARRTVECAFGVLTNKWRVLHTAILVEPEFCDDIVKACCILHNFVRKRDGCNYEETEENFNVQLNDLHTYLFLLFPFHRDSPIQGTNFLLLCANMIFLNPYHYMKGNSCPRDMESFESPKSFFPYQT
ncbi:protein ALP1-like, partial [Aphis craccivora]